MQLTLCAIQTSFPFPKSEWHKIINILYDEMQVFSASVYQYYPSLEAKQQASVTPEKMAKHKEFQRFLISKNGDLHKSIILAIKADAVSMLNTCLQQLDQPLSKNAVIHFIDTAFTNKSFQCIDILLDEYGTKYDIDIVQFEPSLQETYLAYKHNQPKI